METIYNLIKQEIRNIDHVKNSVLGDSHPWKRSHYIILSEIISKNLSEKEELRNEKRFEIGTSISHITLQRFFESDYDYKTHNDLRFIKTLDKICIFLGHKDLNDYVQYLKQLENYSDIIFTREQSFELVYKYCVRNFRFLKILPKIQFEMFDDIIFSDSPFIERIKTYSKELSDLNLELITQNNRSNYEIFDIEIISDEEEKMVIKTQEFWNLVFKQKDSNKEFVINELNTQVYFLKRINNIWKIWDNYNPNSGLLNRIIEKKP